MPEWLTWDGHYGSPPYLTVEGRSRPLACAPDDLPEYIYPESPEKGWCFSIQLENRITLVVGVDCDHRDEEVEIDLNSWYAEEQVNKSVRINEEDGVLVVSLAKGETQGERLLDAVFNRSDSIPIHSGEEFMAEMVRLGTMAVRAG